MITASPALAPAPAAEAAEIRVILCDDSAVIRTYLARMLETDPTVRVVARVANGQLALEALKREPADVMLLDIEMPVMDGLTALPLLLEADPGLRVIIASTLTTRGADIALRALKLGAADYLPKPGAPGGAGTAEFREELLAKVKGLARLRRSARPAPLKSIPCSFARRRRPRRDCSPLRVRPAGRRRCSRWCKGSPVQCAFPWF